ncbi:M23 family metallopeptidase [Henriciella sp. AS95]|uniref:M23 family metallopeptidase n=1 Tax=Henriciella sp. AS95 TaxID=3135782 RepID=UPI00316D821A
MNIQLSRGMTSVALLGVASAAVSLSTFYFIGQARKAEAQPVVQISLAVPLATTLLSADDMDAASAVSTRDGTLKSRETLTELVQNLGATPAEASRALRAVYEAELIDPRRVRPGLEIKANFAGPDHAELTSLSFSNEAGKQILSKRLSDGEFMPVVLSAQTKPVARRISATIDTSIYEAALKQGAHDQQVVDFARIFGYDLDFQRDIHPGDSFEMVYEEMVDERGNRVRSGEVVYAAINGKALNKGYYQFTPSDDGVMDYFDANGEAATKFLMKTPINGARLSSNFGYRRHPISGYNKLHKGTDFAAPSGTPVYAAGHGTIERANRYGGYGNYVRIKHANGYSTAYAHLSRFGKFRSGQRVRQGDIIGYVGSTGASTGPHLHYEVLVRGKQVNAMTLDLPTGRKLADTPDIMEAFIQRREDIDRLGADEAGVTLVSAEEAFPADAAAAPPAP